MASKELKDVLRFIKGGMAEIAFEFLARASGFTVRYTGVQYKEPLLPSTERKRPKEALEGNSSDLRPDFELSRKKRKLGPKLSSEKMASSFHQRLSEAIFWLSSLAQTA